MTLRSVISGSAVALLLTATGCASTGPEEPRRPQATAVREAQPVAPGAETAETVKIVAVGDIACPAGAAVTTRSCRQAATARLTRRVDPDAVLALGDLQYPRASLSQLRASYDKSWGSLKPITKPLPGNHEYDTEGAGGYYRYFGQEAPGYYAWDAGSWRIYNLNSNCDEIDCAAERAWFAQDLADHPTRCTIVAMHHPRWSSGLEHGNNPSVGRFWRVAHEAGVDVALAGHDHDYERFARLDPQGNPDSAGILSFVSGAGGKSLYHRGTRQRGSKIFDAKRAGVLVMWLGDGTFSWRYRTIDGRTPDRGERSCT